MMATKLYLKISQTYWPGDKTAGCSKETGEDALDIFTSVETGTKTEKRRKENIRHKSKLEGLEQSRNKCWIPSACGSSERWRNTKKQKMITKLWTRINIYNVPKEELPEHSVIEFDKVSQYEKRLSKLMDKVMQARRQQRKATRVQHFYWRQTWVYDN